MKNDTPAWLQELIDKGSYKKKYNLFDSDNVESAFISKGKINFNRSNKLIVLEGIPGTGKTSICSELKKRGFNCVDQIVNSGNDSSEKFYLRNDEMKYREARRLLDGICFMDRNFVSTLSYNYAAKKLNKKNAHKMVNQWFEKSIGNKLIIPDVYVWLRVSIQESFKRKNRIPGQKNEIWYSKEGLKLMDDYNKKYFSNRKNFYNLLEIDTEKYSLGQVINEIVKYCNKI